jgi:Carboxypeptidase regulatory-like domain/TonB dependent receptor-like, beta-barrel
MTRSIVDELVHVAVCLAVVVGLGARPVAAQTIRGTITGTVTDSTSAVVPGATVVATNTATGIETSAQTNHDGSYTIPLLQPGTYQARIELTGFRKYVHDGIVVQIAQTTRLDIALQVGQVTEEVQVAGEAPLVRSTTAELGQVIEMKQMQALPLNGRFFQHLITLTPGAMPFYSRGDSAENASAAGARIATAQSVNGMPWSGNNYLMDGVANNEPQNAYINITPPLEAIQEFKVQTNNPTAEFGVFGGAAVNLTIRSGTNDLHGSTFEYLRDDAFNARSFFAPSKAPYNSHQFGGTLGGPIVKNRAFFFGDYQGLRLDQGRTQTLSVPTALMRQGIFTEIGDQIYDPITRQPYAGNIIPGGQINLIARQVADIWPLPNRSGLADNYVENNVITQDVNAGDARVDYKVNNQASIFGRYSLSKRKYDEPAPGNIFMGANNSDSTNFSGVGGYTHVFGSNKFYEVRVGYNKYDTHQYAEDFGINKNNELGIPNGNLPQFPETTGIASFRPSGFSNTGSPGTTNAQRVGRTIHLTNNLSWLKAAHTFKFGADVRLTSGAVTNPQTQPQGRFMFDRLYTSNAGATGTGYSFASFLLGYPNLVQRDIVDTYPEVQRTFVGLFAQDDFRVSRSLTVQLGLRWDLMTPPVQTHDRQSNFSVVDGLIHVASPENRGPDRNTHYDYFAPRLGLAYTPDNGKTAIRAAFGISYFADNFGANGGTSERNYPFFQQIDLVSPTSTTPFRSLSDGLPTFASVPLAPTLTPPAGFAVFYIPPDFREDTATMWNLGVQREIGWSTVVDASYVATRGTDIFRSYNINVPDPGPGAVQSRRPYNNIAPTITTINKRDGDGKSWYDALQLKADKRFSHGVQMLASYTYSKTEDNVTPAGLHPSLANVRMPALSKALDIPHIFVVSATYELPFGRGRRYFSQASGVAGALAEGWTTSIITNYHSGDPLDVRVSASRLNTGTGNWADVTCADISTPHQVDKWFDTSCFADPAQYLFGSYRIGDVRGPTVFNTDFSAFKKTSIGKSAFELRIDVFNVFNRAHFANPNVTFGNSAFGRISATRLTPREIQLGARVLF